MSKVNIPSKARKGLSVALKRQIRYRCRI